MRKVILSILLGMVILLSGCGDGKPMRYHDFYEYESPLSNIASKALEMYRTNEMNQRKFISVGNKKGMFEELDFEVDEELYNLLIQFQNNGMKYITKPQKTCRCHYGGRPNRET